ncbi:flagellar hook-basal body complex protein FliE [Sphingomonas sp. CJ99]
MTGIRGAGDAMGIDRVMQLRAQILERNQALARANQAQSATPVDQAARPVSFADTMQTALAQVNQTQTQAGDLSAQYERGETIDIAKVMMARQQASVAFEATLQVRNKLLSAYKDIMSMPV